MRRCFDDTYLQRIFISNYSASCRDTYALPDSTYVRRDDEKRALCTSEFSDISPLTGGNVAFSTLEGRPSAYNFDESKELQVKASISIAVSYHSVNDRFAIGIRYGH